MAIRFSRGAVQHALTACKRRFCSTLNSHWNVADRGVSSLPVVVPETLVEDYRAQYLKELNEAAQEQNGTEEKRETEFFEMNEELSRHELETEEDMEAFVDDLRGKFLACVRDGKIVILK